MKSGTTAARRRWTDRLGRGVVALGGLAVIASVLGILVFVAAEAAPLFSGARVTTDGRVALPAGAVAPGSAVLLDETRERAAVLGSDGVLRTIDLVRDDQGGHEARPYMDPPEQAGVAGPAAKVTSVARVPGSPAFLAATSDGRALLVPVAWDDGRATAASTAALALDPTGAPVGAVTGRIRTDGGVIAAGQLRDGSIAIATSTVDENAITGEKTATTDRHVVAGPGTLAALAIDDAGRSLWGGTTDGRVAWWPIVDGTPGAPVVVRTGAAVTAMTLLTGRKSLVVGGADGSLAVWMIAKDAHGTPRPVRVRDFPRLAGPVRLLAPSPRDRSFLALDASGHMGLYYSTSHRTLWTGAAPVASPLALDWAPKANGAVLLASGGAARLAIDDPHPEISLSALFGRVWYEGYDRPEYVWQSSSGNDDFEPKLSFVPLVAGTLKGTFYSLALAIPLAVLGAMYTSQFMHRRLRGWVKPAVEMMAAVPSVVLGFLAGLWLAPRLDASFPALVVMVFAVPPASLAAAAAYRRIPARLRARWPAGTEILPVAAAIALAAWGATLLDGPLRSALFGAHFDGRFQGWLRSATGLGYDQRNAVVVGIAMGFAVIPIIFSVAEDAFSNVPQRLVAGSLALGATRWQTVTQVVLPAASPGVFSAIMIGFGRAIGETMIVLMATGNTPITSWNPFNGFRTLSANIAVEIPEAPQGATLYRTLFLAGLLLFALTFAVNTVAELVRQRLRRRYASA